jgi:hypothetical protein
VRSLAVSVRIVAIIGVLVHAGLVAGHGALWQRLLLQQDPLAAALAVICTGGGLAIPQENLPEPPAKDGEHGRYPTCMACASWVAVLPLPHPIECRQSDVSARIELVGEIVARRLAHVRPPPRGPPCTLSS